MEKKNLTSQNGDGASNSHRSKVTLALSTTSFKFLPRVYVPIYQDLEPRRPLHAKKKARQRKEEGAMGEEGDEDEGDSSG